MLSGNGSVGATTVGYGSILAPGNSIGTMAVNGNLTLDPGALYEVEANAQGQSDKVIVKGTVNLTGATLYVLAAGGAQVSDSWRVGLATGASWLITHFGVMGREQLWFPTASVAQTWYWALDPCGFSTVARHKYSPYQRIGIS